MTLTSGRFIDHEYDRMIVRFSMHDGAREIPCAISTSAMDYLEHGPGRQDRDPGDEQNDLPQGYAPGLASARNGHGSVPPGDGYKGSPRRRYGVKKQEAPR